MASLGLRQRAGPVIKVPCENGGNKSLSGHVLQFLQMCLPIQISCYLLSSGLRLTADGLCVSVLSGAFSVVHSPNDPRWPSCRQYADIYVVELKEIGQVRGCTQLLGTPNLFHAQLLSNGQTKTRCH